MRHWAKHRYRLEQGLLNILLCGDKTVFDKVKPARHDLGENVFHLGGPGSGHIIKLINNFFAMTTATAISEAFALADVAVIVRQKLYDVMSAGPLYSTMMDTIKVYAVDGDGDQLTFTLKNAKKDVIYYSTMTEQAGITSLMSQSGWRCRSLWPVVMVTGMCRKYLIS